MPCLSWCCLPSRPQGVSRLGRLPCWLSASSQLFQFRLLMEGPLKHSEFGALGGCRLGSEAMDGSAGPENALSSVPTGPLVM